MPKVGSIEPDGTRYTRVGCCVDAGLLITIVVLLPLLPPQPAKAASSRDSAMMRNIGSAAYRQREWCVLAASGGKARGARA